MNLERKTKFNGAIPHTYSFVSLARGFLKTNIPPVFCVCVEASVAPPEGLSLRDG